MLSVTCFVTVGEDEFDILTTEDGEDAAIDETTVDIITNEIINSDTEDDLKFLPTTSKQGTEVNNLTSKARIK